jgi:hypothetical protein
MAFTVTYRDTVENAGQTPYTKHSLLGFGLPWRWVKSGVSEVVGGLCTAMAILYGKLNEQAGLLRWRTSLTSNSDALVDSIRIPPPLPNPRQIRLKAIVPLAGGGE